MPLFPLSRPPVQQPFDLASGTPNPAWTKWFNDLYLWVGESSGISPLSISGVAATAANATPILNAGAPEGVQQAIAGSTYVDTATNTVYLKSQGDDTTGWIAV